MMKHKNKVMTAVLCFVLMINSFTTKVQASNTDKAEDGKATVEENTTQEDGSSKTKVKWPKGPKIEAGAAVVMEVETGLVLYEKNPTQKNYPASITKILTSLVAIENSSLSETVTFTKDSVFNVEKGSSSCGFDWGEEVSLEDCLYGIMLQSGNEAAYGVAEHVGGTFDHFVEMMNDRAKELGCINSHFANPHGLSNENHYTCPYDMALISSAAIKNTSFAKITGTRSHTMGPTNKQKDSRTWANHQKFVKKELKYDGCIGGKTGWTTKSKYTLVTFAKREGMTLVCVIMNEADPTKQYTETAKLLDFGFDNFSISHICEEDDNKLLEEQAFYSQYSDVLSGENPLLTVSDDTYVILPDGVSLDDVEKKVDLNTAGEAKQEDESKVIGSIQYTYHDKLVGKGDILLNQRESKLPSGITSMIEPTDAAKDGELSQENAKAAPKNIVTEKKKRNLKPYIVAVILGTIVLVLIIYYLIVERPRRKRRKAYLERRKNHRYYD